MEDKEIIVELEKIIGSKIPVVTKYDQWTKEVRYDEKGRIIGLKLEWSHLKEIPAFFENLTELEFLSLHFNEIAHIPEFLVKMTKLRVLRLSKNKLTQISPVISHLSSIEELEISENQMTELPPFLTSMPHLRSISLVSNPLTFNQSNIEIIKSLFAKDQISTIPSVFWLYKHNIPESQIKIVNNFIELTGNKPFQIITNPAKENQSKRELQISEKKLIGIRSEYTKLTGGKLPESFAAKEGLIDLKYLNLHDNELMALPDNFGNLTELEYLNLNQNKLSSFPKSMTQISHLKELYCAKNQFTTIPKVLWPNKDLTKLDFTGNPLESDQENLARKSPQDIIDTLRKSATINIFISHAVQDVDQFHLYEFKQYLEKQAEIADVFLCEENLQGNIDEWMADTVPKSHMVFFFASQKSVFNSPDCHNELELANKYSIPTIPIKGQDVGWEDLMTINISRELGFEFPPESEFEQFCASIYKYIYDFKRNIDLMHKKTRYLGITNVYERFQIMLKNTQQKSEQRVQALEQQVEDLLKRLEKLESKT